MKKTFFVPLFAGTLFLFACNDSKTTAENTTSTEVNGNRGETQNVEAQATEELCNCINGSLNNMDPKVRTIIVKAGESSEPIQVLQSEMLKITDKEQQQKIANEFRRFESDPQLQTCSEKIKKKFGFNDADQASQGKILEAARQNKNCDVVYALMKIGMQQQASEGDAGIGGDSDQ